MFPINPNFRLDRFAGKLQKAGIQEVDIMLIPARIRNSGSADGTRSILQAIIVDGRLDYAVSQVDYPYWPNISKETAVAQRNRLTEKVLKRVGVLEARGLKVTIEGKTPDTVRKGLEAFGYSTEMQHGRR